MERANVIPVHLEWVRMPRLRACSLLTRAVWWELVALMWEAQPRGFLVSPTRTPLSEDALARIVGVRTAELRQTINELLGNGLLETDPDGVLYCSFLTEEGLRRWKRQWAGRMGAKKRWAKTQAYQKNASASSASNPSFEETDGGELTASRDAQKIGIDASKNGKHSKPDGKTIANPMANAWQNPIMPAEAALEMPLETSVGESLADDGVFCRKENGDNGLGPCLGGSFEAAASETLADSPPNTPPKEFLSNGGGETGVVVGLVGIGGLRGEGMEREGGGGFEQSAKAIFETTAHLPTQEAHGELPMQVGTPPSGVEPEGIRSGPLPVGPGGYGQAPRPPWGELKNILDSKPQTSFRAIQQPPPDPMAAQADPPESDPPDPVKTRFQALGRLWRLGEPIQQRDRRLLWQVVFLSLHGLNEQRIWAETALKTLEAAKPRNPGAYLQKLVLQLGRQPDGPDIGLVLARIQTPAWVNRRIRPRSPPTERPLPLFPMSETERAEILQTIAECRNLVLGKKQPDGNSLER